MRPTSDRTLSAQQFVDFDPNLSSTTSGTNAIAEQTAKSLIGLSEHCADCAIHHRGDAEAPRDARFIVICQHLKAIKSTILRPAQAGSRPDHYTRARRT